MMIDYILFGDLVRRYIDTYSSMYKKSWKEDESIFYRYLTQWKDKEIRSITNKDINEIVMSIGEKNGFYAANRLRSFISSLFNFAITEGFLTVTPFIKIYKFPEEIRNRYLSEVETPRLIEAIMKEPERDFFLLLLITGINRGCLLSLKWEEVDIDSKCFNFQGRIIRMNDYAYFILKSRFDKIKTESFFTPNPFVFPSKSKSGHFEEPKSAWQRILEKSNIKDLRISDLRRGFILAQMKSGASLSDVFLSSGLTYLSSLLRYAAAPCSGSRKEEKACEKIK